MSRDTAISQTAAAMLAWFQTELSPNESSSSTKASDKLSSPTAVQAAAAAAHVPLATVGLKAAATTAAAAAPAAADAAAENSERAVFGRQIRTSFKDWVLTPLTQQEVEFTVKGSPGL
jgi:hypothetical protein